MSGGPHRCAAVSSAVINIRTNPRLSREEPIASEKQARCAQHPCSGWPRAAVSHLPEACSRLCLFLLEVKRAAKNIQINESRRPAMRAEVLSKTAKATQRHPFKIVCSPCKDPSKQRKSHDCAVTDQVHEVPYTHNYPPMTTQI